MKHCDESNRTAHFQIRTAGAGLLLLMFFLFASSAKNSFGQTFTATLTGVVSDPQGAVIPDAEVEIKNTATNDVQRGRSAADGSYIFTNLLPGDYELTAKAQGFKTFVHRNITLLAGRSSELNVRLELGQVAQTVEVTERAVLLDTRSADHTATLTSTMVTELPTNSRNPLNFVFAFAGTTQPTTSYMYSPDGTLDQNFNTFGLQGGRSGSSQVLLDGAPATAADWGGLIVAPTTEAVQEMQVVRNTYDSQYGKSGGGIITLISKSGTQRFHGVAYDYLRNDNLDANSWGNNLGGAPRGELKRNQFGGNIGGPIWASKNLFFFGAYEGLRQPFTGSSEFRSVPTLSERQGDFSQSYNAPNPETGLCADPADLSDPSCRLQVLYNPFTTRPDPNNPGQFLRDPFDPTCVGVIYPDTCPGNVVPSNLIDPVAAQVVQLYPEPNRAGDPMTQSQNYFKQGTGRTTNDKVEARVDWAHNDKHRMFGRWSQRLRQKSDNPCYYCNGADSDYDFRNSGSHITLTNTFTPTPTWVVNVLVGAGYSLEEQISASLGVLTPSSIGLNDADFHAPLLPYFSVAEYADLGNPAEQKVRKFPRYVNTLQINATKELGSHTLKFGWNGEDSKVNNIDRFAGRFYFGRGMTSGPVAATDSSETGNALASLLMGTVAGGDSIFNADIAMTARYYGWYFQDTWRVTPRLTLILGMRYELQPAATERYNRLTYFNPNVDSPLASQVGLPLKGGFQYADSSNRGAWQTDKSDIAPRLGLAYKLTDKLVMRAGLGVFYGPSTAMITFGQPGQHVGFSTQTNMVTSVGGGGLIPNDLLSNPYPDGLNQPTGTSAGLMALVGEGMGQIWPYGEHPTGYKQHFSLDFQYEIRPGSAFEIGYTGFRARKLMFGEPGLNVNQLHPQYLSMGDALNEQVPNPFYGVITSGFLSDPTVARHQLLRPFPQFGGLNWTRSLPGATANYDSLNLKFTHQFRSGLSLLSTYQWSKTLDTGSEDFIGWGIGGQWRDYHNRKQEYSISAHDMPHSFVTALVYELPFGRGKKWGTNWPGVANQTLGGWQVSTVVNLSSGLPLFPISTGSNPLGQYGFGYYPVDLVGNPRLDNPTPGRWFNTDAFRDHESVDSFSYGNAPRYHSGLRQQGTKNVDLAVVKNFKTEAFKIQFRAEFLNAFNTPQFGGGDQWWSNISTCMYCAEYGQVWGVRNLPRNIQLGLKFEF